MFDKEFLSIDIGTENTKIVVGKQQGNNVNISSAFMFLTPTGSIQDGRINDMDKLIESIKRSLTKYRISTKKTIITIESTSIIRRELDLPMVKPEDLETMVRIEAEQYLPIVMSDYIIEFKIIDEYVEDEVKKCKILVVAIPKNIAEGYLHLIRALNLTPTVLDINSNAVSKLFSFKNTINEEQYNTNKTIAVMDMGYSSINLNIISKGSSRFSRLINSGGYDIDINIANSFNLEMDDAEDKKKNEVEINSQIVGSLDAMLNEAARSCVDNWLSEIDRMFQYYTSRDNRNKIDEIYIYGGSSGLIGLEEYFSTYLNIPTRRLESISNIKINKSTDFQLQYFINSIGAIIRK